MNSKYDWDLMEREYVTGDDTLRGLAARHGITSHSTVRAQAISREWVRKRSDYRKAASDKTVLYMADHEGMRRAQEARVREHAIEAIDEAIMKLRSDMKLTEKHRDVEGNIVERPLFILEPRDVAMLMDRLNVFFGRPSEITEERTLGLNVNASTGPVGTDLLRSIVEATRGVGEGPGSSSSPIPRAGRAGTN